MKYVKATTILPEELLVEIQIVEIQKYVQGRTIYIPKQTCTYQKCGLLSGGRKKNDERNAYIINEYYNGKCISQLAQDYFLSTDTIKKIVYSKR
ncbi:CD3324 family protein [Bacillus sp. FSL K6-3431]|uniref:CD3324 family protein n=1 Tax=Bacillus sp. FSL K6-3431 TaxID=2921500 RepID=UPI0030F7C324